MHVGLFMECDYRIGATEEEAVREAFSLVELGEKSGLDGVWLAERHFASPQHFQERATGGVPSIASAPLILASAIAARTERMRIGLAVSVLPLAHPIRLAEEVATLDQISEGRLDFGIGRSGFQVAYAGYGIPYEDSRGRFQECLDIMLQAWSEDMFSYEGRYYSFKDVCVVPKPRQKPHPPLRIAATTSETFPLMGKAGYPLFIGLRGIDIAQNAANLALYREAWKEAGHPGNGDVYLRIPVYVGATAEQAYEEPMESTLSSYKRRAEGYANAQQAAGTPEERAAMAENLRSSGYDELLKGRLAYGTAESVTRQLQEMREQLGLSGVIVEANVGGAIPRELVYDSVRRLAEEVVPALHEDAAR